MHPFQLIHCDLWTSPITSVSGHQYYLVIIDDFSHYVWTFPLRKKSDTFPTLSDFFAYVRTQFGVPVQGIQCDNGLEFNNSSSRAFFLTNGIHLRMSCPYTSPQNGKAERMIRTVNDTVWCLLFQASVPPRFWAAALSTATYLLNILPTKTLSFSTPHFSLFAKPPSYVHLRVFGCKCYPNLTAIASNKLSPRSTLCVFLGYSPHHKGYLCLDRHTNRIIISRHVTFDKTSFPFSESTSSTTHSHSSSRDDYNFLDDLSNPVDLPFPPSLCSPPAGSSGAIAALRAGPDCVQTPLVLLNLIGAGLQGTSLHLHHPSAPHLRPHRAVGLRHPPAPLFLLPQHPLPMSHGVLARSMSAVLLLPLLLIAVSVMCIVDATNNLRLHTHHLLHHLPPLLLQPVLHSQQHHFPQQHLFPEGLFLSTPSPISIL